MAVFDASHPPAIPTVLVILLHTFKFQMKMVRLLVRYPEICRLVRPLHLVLLTFIVISSLFG